MPTHNNKLIELTLCSHAFSTEDDTFPSSRRNPGGWTREMTREVAMETRRATEYSQRPPGALKPGSCNSPPITAYLRAKDIWQKKYIHY